MKRKSIILVALVFTALATIPSHAVLLITGIVDGNETGGQPKAMEIYTTTNIADLSTYYLARDTNGAGPWDTFFQLPAVALSAGSFFYIAGDADAATYLTTAGFAIGVTSNILNVNGDDIIGLATGNTPTDVYDSIGVVAQGDTDFYADSFAVRSNSSVNPTTTATDGSNFVITTWGDGSAFEGSSGLGTYAPVPEPSVALLGGLGLLTLLRRRRVQ